MLYSWQLEASAFITGRPGESEICSHAKYPISVQGLERKYVSHHSDHRPIHNGSHRSYFFQYSLIVVSWIIIKWIAFGLTMLVTYMSIRLSS